MKATVDLSEDGFYFTKDYSRTVVAKIPQKYKRFIDARHRKIKQILKNKNDFFETLVYENGIITWEIQEIENAK